MGLLALANATSLLSSGSDRGLAMPSIGYGCAGVRRVATLVDAISAGYRLFDTAQATEWYSETTLGAALAAVPRADAAQVFVTTKVHPRDFGAAQTAAVIASSLRRLRLRAIDLVLLHYPRCTPELCDAAAAARAGAAQSLEWPEAWRALELAHDAGRVRAIGVSNFNTSSLDALWAHARVRPAVVQNWMEPFNANRQLREWCVEHRVTFQAYATLGTMHMTDMRIHKLMHRIHPSAWLSSTRKNPVLRSATLAAISHERGRTVAQIALRWALQHGALVIPHSSNSQRLRENLRLFDFALTQAEMARIDALDGRRGDA